MIQEAKKWIEDTIEDTIHRTVNDVVYKAVKDYCGILGDALRASEESKPRKVQILLLGRTLEDGNEDFLPDGPIRHKKYPKYPTKVVPFADGMTQYFPKGQHQFQFCPQTLIDSGMQVIVFGADLLDCYVGQCSSRRIPGGGGLIAYTQVPCHVGQTITVRFEVD